MGWEEWWTEKVKGDEREEGTIEDKGQRMMEGKSGGGRGVLWGGMEGRKAS